MSMSTLDTTGSAVRAIRESLGLSLAELAERSGRSTSYLGQVERGERTATDEWLWSVKVALASAMRG